MFGPGLGLVQQYGGDGACVVTTQAKDGRGDVDYDDGGKGDVMGSGRGYVDFDDLFWIWFHMEGILLLKVHLQTMSWAAWAYELHKTIHFWISLKSMFFIPVVMSSGLSPEKMTTIVFL